MVFILHLYFGCLTPQSMLAREGLWCEAALHGCSYLHNSDKQTEPELLWGILLSIVLVTASVQHLAHGGREVMWEWVMVMPRRSSQCHFCMSAILATLILLCCHYWNQAMNGSPTAETGTEFFPVPVWLVACSFLAALRKMKIFRLMYPLVFKCHWLKKKKDELAKLSALPSPDSATSLNSVTCMGLVCLSGVKHTLNMYCWILKADT